MWQQIIQFWYQELTPKQWYIKDLQVDQLIDQRFGRLNQQAQAGELYTWRQEPLGRLAEIIVLDQFSRNLYRDSALAFAGDAMALTLAQEAIYHGLDKAMDNAQKQFLYMPFMHSESAAIHVKAEALFANLGNDNTLSFERQHKAIIDRFGRYPHRNAILDRESTSAEIAFLTQPGSSF
ncbi:MAG TPA: DUF924 domain-containing protein [Oceanospirillaceae bacterium]|nr:DUF924 domain-containing protein [Oceanospirillaceae bacterium]